LLLIGALHSDGLAGVERNSAHLLALHRCQIELPQCSKETPIHQRAAIGSAEAPTPHASAVVPAVRSAGTETWAWAPVVPAKAAVRPIAGLIVAAHGVAIAPRGYPWRRGGIVHAAATGGQIRCG
jgi:hypothetical protein